MQLTLAAPGASPQASVPRPEPQGSLRLLALGSGEPYWCFMRASRPSRGFLDQATKQGGISCPSRELLGESITAEWAVGLLGTTRSR